MRRALQARRRLGELGARWQIMAKLSWMVARQASRKRAARVVERRVVGQKPGAVPLHLHVVGRCRVVLGQADQGQDHEDARGSRYDVTQERVPHAYMTPGRGQRLQPRRRASATETLIP